ncbi:Hypothetical_protein [Hexamita inflata]|uniref:Hypothetical_protein n=1 Tax=Hexamita inflata TaxID=28002 RepID=A0AA86QAD2_9EUKA|nr:Hypothetical protein HINF_LOCUS42920 [Hexamita inflata]
MKQTSFVNKIQPNTGMLHVQQILTSRRKKSFNVVKHYKINKQELQHHYLKQKWLAYNLHPNYYRKRYDGPSRIISRTSTSRYRETSNSNAGTQNSSIKPKKKPRQKSQVQHSQEIQAQMNTQTQPSQVTKNTDNTQTNQRAINIQKQVVVNNFNCNNTSLSGQSKSQSTNKSQVARKSQNQQNPKQTAPKQVYRKLKAGKKSRTLKMF